MKNNKILKIRVLSLVLIIACISDCKNAKKKQEDLGFFSLSEIKNYLYFKPGSWWVYKNTATNELDTIILTSCNLDTIHAISDVRKFDYEIINYSMKSKRDGAIYFVNCPEMYPYGQKLNKGWKFECLRTGGLFTNFFQWDGVSTQFFYPLDSNKSVGNGVYSTNFIGRKDSIHLNSKIFYDLILFKSIHDGSAPYPNVFFGQTSENKYYWAENFGLVKIAMIGTDSNHKDFYMNWELIEYNIIK